MIDPFDAIGEVFVVSFDFVEEELALEGSSDGKRCSPSV